MSEVRRVDQVVDPCRHCGQAHTISLNAVVETPSRRPAWTPYPSSASFFGADRRRHTGVDVRQLLSQALRALADPHATNQR